MDTPDLQPVTQNGDAPGHRPGRKRKVKRSSRIKKRLPFIIALVLAWVVLLALWYYLAIVGIHPAPEPVP